MGFTLNIVTSAYIGNVLAIILLYTMLSGHRWNLYNVNEARKIKGMIIINLICCIIDPLMYTCDGLSGTLITVFVYLGNSIMYISNMVIGIIWVEFIRTHLGMALSKKHKVLIYGTLVFGVICVIINIFKPIIFSVEDNVYHRRFLYWIYAVLAMIYMIDSMALYYKAKIVGGVLKFFPINIFLTPIFIGIVIQSIFYGTSVAWATVAIALSGLTNAMHNEIIFRDRLTGLFNRSYLEYMHKQFEKKKSLFITGIMLDLNDFKSINDKFGHATGDDALITVSNLFKKAVGDFGSVIRYAGDEFVILINTYEEDQARSCCELIKRTLDEYNQTGEKPYTLSVSFGYALLDLKNQTMNDFLNKIDSKMYEDKEKYYRSKGIDK